MYVIRDWLARFRFAKATAGILRTAPVHLDAASNLTVLTQLQHKDVLMALVAFKSFAARVPVGRICIVDDGSLEADDRALLAEHLPAVQFLELAAVRTPACPANGCWERLLWIARLNSSHYVVQLDSDTLTLGAIDEVARCVDQGRSFSIGTWDDQEIESMAERRQTAAAIIAREPGPHHVQLVAEANFDALADISALQYIRGCAGFSGFARGSVDASFIESISRQMMRRMAAAWRQWGSEQVMSNIVVANARAPVVLPHPKYCDCTRIRPGRTAFVHFIGSCRFSGGVYQQSACDVIAAMDAGVALAAPVANAP